MLLVEWRLAIQLKSASVCEMLDAFADAPAVVLVPPEAADMPGLLWQLPEELKAQRFL